MNKININWIEFIEDCQKLADKINCYNLVHTEKITDIMSIARGGGIPSEIVAYKCNINFISSVGMSYYDKNDKKMAEPIIYQDVPTNLQNRKILVVDEICDTGGTFLYVVEKLKEHGCTNIGTACVYRKKGSMFLPDIYLKEVNNEDWIVMPYE